jgi:hypothetical protein
MYVKNTGNYSGSPLSPTEILFRRGEMKNRSSQMLTVPMGRFFSSPFVDVASRDLLPFLWRVAIVATMGYTYFFLEQIFCRGEKHPLSFYYSSAEAKICPSPMVTLP